MLVLLLFVLCKCLYFHICHVLASCTSKEFIPDILKQNVSDKCGNKGKNVYCAYYLKTSDKVPREVIRCNLRRAGVEGLFVRWL